MRRTSPAGDAQARNQLGEPLNRPVPPRGSPRGRAGVAMLELALVLPLLMLMLLGAIDFARVYYESIAVASAARAGAQYGAQKVTTSGDFAGMQQAALNDLTGVTGVTVTASRYCQCPNGSTVNCTTGTCAGTQINPRIYVTVTVTKTFTTLFPYPGIPNPVVLTRVATVRAR